MRDVQSVTQIQYGLTTQLTIGFIPIVDYNASIESSSKVAKVGLGDFSALAQYEISNFDSRRGFPAVSMIVEKTFPTGKYDRLSGNPSNGSGAYVNCLGLYAQTYLWMPNGRILRARANLTGPFSSSVSIAGISAYDTPEGFTGNARPGMSVNASIAGEYSMTQKIALALDLTYRHARSTLITGSRIPAPNDPSFSSRWFSNSGSADAFGLAPAIEYNLTSDIGILAGAQFIPRSHGVPSSITPAIAINMFY